MLDTLSDIKDNSKFDLRRLLSSLSQSIGTIKNPGQKVLFYLRVPAYGELENHHPLRIIFYVSCIILLILCTYSILPSFLRIGIVTNAQESSVLSCSDGSVPDASTGLCADGFAPESSLSEFSSTAPDSAELAGDNVTAMSNITAGQLLDENQLVSGEINVSAAAPEEIQMDTNGDGIVDGTESQNQPLLRDIYNLDLRRILKL